MAASRGIQYIPAIDGLRAVAVIAVMFYHLGFTWIPGGFLGVDLFFVISGYVITRLLLDSIEQSGGLDLVEFIIHHRITKRCSKSPERCKIN
jgi:peptidoglycan/LPS O-acetylase OafA/YrhL